MNLEQEQRITSLERAMAELRDTLHLTLDHNDRTALVVAHHELAKQRHQILEEAAQEGLPPSPT